LVSGLLERDDFVRALTLAILMTAALSAPAWAREQSTPEAPKDRQALGVSISNMAGSGFTYLNMNQNGFGWRVAGVGWGSQGSGAAFWNVGGAFLREFDRKEWGSIYGLLGAGAGIRVFSGGFGLPSSGGPEINLAPGIGVNYGPFFLEGGYSVWHNDADKVGFGPAFGGGVLYWF
jgi:hypothetical protein